MLMKLMTVALVVIALMVIAFGDGGVGGDTLMMVALVMMAVIPSRSAVMECVLTGMKVVLVCLVTLFLVLE